MWKKPMESDWFFMSMCSAHLEQRHQWADGVGVEDNLHITTEEWAYYELDKEFVGLSAHVLDLSTKTLYATAAFTNGGFEKIADVNVSTILLLIDSFVFSFRLHFSHDTFHVIFLLAPTF